jgi:hypothetical protein
MHLGELVRISASSECFPRPMARRREQLSVLRLALGLVERPKVNLRPLNASAHSVKLLDLPWTLCGLFSGWERLVACHCPHYSSPPCYPQHASGLC